MACCAMPGGCADPACYLCTVVAKLPQPTTASDLRKNDRADHREAVPLPDYSAPRSAAGSLAFVKRKRWTREGSARGNGRSQPCTI